MVLEVTIYRRAITIAMIGIIIIPIVVSLVFVIDGEVAARVLFSRTFTEARLATIAQISVRAMFVATLGTVMAVPVGLWLGVNEGKRQYLIISSALIAPFFISNAIKSFEWAEILRQLHNYIASLAGSGQVFAGGTVSLLISPYNPSSAIIPLCLNQLPILAFIIAIGYKLETKDHLVFFVETSAYKISSVFFLGLMQLSKYFLFSWVVAFGMAFGSSTEDQFLGGPIPNNISTLMESLLRTGSLETQLFSSAMLLLYSFLSWGAWYLVASHHDLLSSVKHRNLFFDLLVYRFLNFIKNISTSKYISKHIKGNKNLLYFSFRVMLKIYIFGILFLSWIPVVWALGAGLSRCDSFGCHITAENIVSAFTSPRVIEAIISSLSIGFFCWFAGAFLAMWGFLTVVYRRWSAWVGSLFVICLIAPPDPIAIGIQQCLKIAGIDNSFFPSVALSHIQLIFPFCAAFGVLSINNDIRNAMLSIDEYRLSFWRICNIVIGKVAWGAALSSSLLGFVLSINDHIRMLYLGGAHESISGYINGQLRAGYLDGDRTVFGVGVILISVGTFITVMVMTMVSPLSAAKK